jgi:peptide/nickel transport system ATP-binding protein
LNDLKKYYSVGLGRNPIKAVDGVSFSIGKGESFGLVGESGSGKSTLGLCLIRLIEPTSGRIAVEGRDVTFLKGKALKSFRSRCSIVYQNPASSLDPSWTVEQTVSEPLTVDGKYSKGELKTRVAEALAEVNLPDYLSDRFPHELSGGQAQRVAIARALIKKPQLVILDEPTSALDVSVQAQLLNLLLDIQKKFGLTYLFISHDLNVVGHLCDRMAVMYLGKVVEVGDAIEIYNSPLHPYTQALVSTVPVITPGFSKYRLRGEPPSPRNPPLGCRFNTRCPYATSLCREKEPPLQEVTSGHFVACHNLDLVRSGSVQVPENFGQLT